MDLYSRRIFGWQLSKHRTAEVTLAALRQALTGRKIRPGMLFHTDRGPEYGAWALHHALKSIDAYSSMNRAESVADNAHMESFFRTMKTEALVVVPFETKKELRQIIASYIDGFYNTKRLHSCIGYKYPIECDKMAT